MSSEPYNLPVNPPFNLSLDSELRKIAMEALQRLTTDKRMKKVIQKLQKKGIEDRHIKWLLETLPTIYGEWELIKIESLKEQRKRHAKLKKKMDELIKELNASEDTRYISVCDALILRRTYQLSDKAKDLMKRGMLNPDAIVLSHYGTSPSPVLTPTITEYLKGFARMLKDDDLISEFDKEYFNKLPYKRNMQSYAIMRVSELIWDIINVPEIKGRQFPNKEVAIIVTVLLNPDKAIKANDVTQSRKNVRREYTYDVD